MSCTLLLLSFLVANENESGLYVSRGTLTAVNRYRARKREENSLNFRSKTSRFFRIKIQKRAKKHNKVKIR